MLKTYLSTTRQQHGALAGIDPNLTRRSSIPEVVHKVESPSRGPVRLVVGGLDRGRPPVVGAAELTGANP